MGQALGGRRPLTSWCLSRAGLAGRPQQRWEINFETVRVTYENSERPSARVLLRGCARGCVVLCWCVSGSCLRTQDVPGIQELQLCFQPQLFQALGDECQTRRCESAVRVCLVLRCLSFFLCFTSSSVIRHYNRTCFVQSDNNSWNLWSL